MIDKLVGCPVSFSVKQPKLQKAQSKYSQRVRRTARFILCLLFVFILASCGDKNKSVTIPSNILSKEKMAAVLTDIHIAEAEAGSRTLPDSTSKVPVSFEKIFEKDSISKSQYEESLSFYMDHPDLLDTVYVQVLNELSKMQGQAGK